MDESPENLNAPIDSYDWVTSGIIVVPIGQTLNVVNIALPSQRQYRLVAEVQVGLNPATVTLLLRGSSPNFDVKKSRSGAAGTEIEMQESGSALLQITAGADPATVAWQIREPLTAN